MGGLVVTSSAWDWYQSSIAEHLAHKYRLSASQVKKNTDTLIQQEQREENENT